MQFLSQPFVVGDRVEILTSGGGRVTTGTIERVDPMRTILRSDAEMPITMPNKVPYGLFLSLDLWFWGVFDAHRAACRLTDFLPWGFFRSQTA